MQAIKNRVAALAPRSARVVRELFGAAEARAPPEASRKRKMEMDQGFVEAVVLSVGIIGHWPYIYIYIRNLGLLMLDVFEVFNMLKTRICSHFDLTRGWTTHSSLPMMYGFIRIAY